MFPARFQRRCWTRDIRCSRSKEHHCSRGPRVSSRTCWKNVLVPLASCFRMPARRRSNMTGRSRKASSRAISSGAIETVMQSVLSGIRVVEQGTFITGPCAGMMLADLVADVIKVESPTGDPYRSYQGGQFSPHFQAYNRNKRGLVLDLNQPSDRGVFEGLIRNA